MGTLIGICPEAGNTIKGLESWICIYPLCFYTVIHLSSSQIFIFLGAAAGPVDHYTIDFFPRAETESHRQFRLRKIAGAAADDPRLSLPVEENADGRADRIAIRFCALQIKSNAAGVRLLVVAVQIRRTVVRCQEDVEVAVAVEIAESEAATNFGRFETASNLAGDVAEFSGT